MNNNIEMSIIATLFLVGAMFVTMFIGIMGVVILVTAKMFGGF